MGAKQNLYIYIYILSRDQIQNEDVFYGARVSFCWQGVAASTPKKKARGNWQADCGMRQQADRVFLKLFLLLLFTQHK